MLRTERAYVLISSSFMLYSPFSCLTTASLSHLISISSPDFFALASGRKFFVCRIIHPSNKVPFLLRSTVSIDYVLHSTPLLLQDHLYTSIMIQPNHADHYK